MRARLRRFPLVIVLVLVLTAGAVAAVASAASKSPKRTGALSGSLTVMENWTGAEGTAFQAVIDGFKAKNSGVDIKLVQVPFNQTQAQLAQQFAAGTGPDVAVALPGIVRDFSKSGLLMNLDDLWSKWISSGQYNRSLRAIAQGSDKHTDSIIFKGNVNALVWYEPKVMRKLGLKVPKTWPQFIAGLNKAKKAGATPFEVGGADQWPLTQWVDPIILRVAGAKAFNALERGQIPWNTPSIVKSFRVLGGLIKNYWSPNSLSLKFSDEVCAWANGKVLFDNQGAFVNLIAPSQCNSKLKPGRDYSFFLMPKYNAKAPLGQFVSGDLFVGNAHTKNPEAAKALLTYLGSPAAQSIWARRGGYIAPNAKVPMSVYPTINDRKAAALWPKGPKALAGYDLDDWIGGEIQVKYRQALAQFVRDQNVSRFISAMTKIDTRSKS
ncbi:MAG TPA: extracellular solute-binding protein [Gaiellaceae bacterium]|jgi:alpha-glucoside transport system substrate-binding protein